MNISKLLNKQVNSMLKLRKEGIEKFGTYSGMTVYVQYNKNTKIVEIGTLKNDDTIGFFALPYNKGYGKKYITDTIRILLENNNITDYK